MPYGVIDFDLWSDFAWQSLGREGKGRGIRVRQVVTGGWCSLGDLEGGKWGYGESGGGFNSGQSCWTNEKETESGVSHSVPPVCQKHWR